LWRPRDARQGSVQCLSDGVSIVSFFVVIRKGDSNASIRVLEKLTKPNELLEGS
jgi:hypothetical protein